MAKRHLTVFERELAAMYIVKLDSGYAAFNMMRGLGGNVSLTRPGGFMHRDSILWRPPKVWKEESVAAERIRRIHVGEVVTPLLFGILRMRDDRITIETTDGKEFSYLRSEEGKYFDKYRRELAEFARENGITFSDRAPSAAGGG